jgi:hypothetical protein
MRGDDLGAAQPALPFTVRKRPVDRVVGHRGMTVEV